MSKKQLIDDAKMLATNSSSDGHKIIIWCSQRRTQAENVHSAKERVFVIRHLGFFRLNPLTCLYGCRRISDVVNNLFTDGQNQAKILPSANKRARLFDNKVEFSFRQGKLNVIDNFVLVIDDCIFGVFVKVYLSHTREFCDRQFLYSTTR